MSKIVKLVPDAYGFAEDKEQARNLRKTVIAPSLGARETVVLDFEDVTFATQSFVHALIGESLAQHGKGALGMLEFRNCSDEMRGLITLVVDYSLGGFRDDPKVAESTPESIR